MQERFYFGDAVLPLFESGIPLLLQQLQSLRSENIAIAYPDEGAWKRFHGQFQDFPEVCSASHGMLPTSHGAAMGTYACLHGSYKVSTSSCSSDARLMLVFALQQSFGRDENMYTMLLSARPMSHSANASQACAQVVCTKVRDGAKRLVRLKEGNPEGQHVVIVDDLVQSGGTLIECGKLLRENGARHVSAYVTHGVFPKASFKRFEPERDDGAFGWRKVSSKLCTR